MHTKVLVVMVERVFGERRQRMRRQQNVHLAGDRLSGEAEKLMNVFPKCEANVVMVNVRRLEKLLKV